MLSILVVRHLSTHERLRICLQTFGLFRGSPSDFRDHVGTRRVYRLGLSPERNRESCRNWTRRYRDIIPGTVFVVGNDENFSRLPNS